MLDSEVVYFSNLLQGSSSFPIYLMLSVRKGLVEMAATKIASVGCQTLKFPKAFSFRMSKLNRRFFIDICDKEAQLANVT